MAVVASPVCTDLVPPQNTDLSEDRNVYGNDTHHHSEHRLAKRKTLRATTAAPARRLLVPTVRAYLVSLRHIARVLPLSQQFIPEKS